MTAKAPSWIFDALSGLITEMVLAPVLAVSSAFNRQLNTEGETSLPGTNTSGETSTIPPPEILTAAAVSISGGGMVEVSPLVLVPGNDVSPSVLSWRLKALDTARTGARTISVINPDNASKIQEGAFAVTPSAQLTASPGCNLGDRTSEFPALGMVLGMLLWCVVRRRES